MKRIDKLLYPSTNCQVCIKINELIDAVSKLASETNIVTLRPEFEIGDIVTWNAPYGSETVSIDQIYWNKKDKIFQYKTKEYEFWIDEVELEEMK